MPIESKSQSSSPPSAASVSDNTPDVPHLPSGLDSGDIVLFNRRCSSMPVAGAALCVVSKLFSNSQWDHVGVVIRDPRTGELLFLEADFGGVKLRSLHERVKRSKSNEIAFRKLSIVRTSSMREKFYAFAQEMVGTPYEIGTGTIRVRVTDPLAKQERERLNALLLDKEAQLKEISRELETAVVTTFQRKLLEGERSRILEQCQTIQGRLKKEFDAHSPVEKNTNSNSANSELTSKNDLSRVFCSELVAAAYQRVGLLGSYPPPFYYNPKDLSSQQTHPPGVHLLKGARLGKEIFYRKSAISIKRDAKDGTKRKNFRGVYDGDNPTKASRALIRDSLKRTPVYNQVPDEYKRSHLVKSFRARIIEPGDVVFEQGQYGDQIYVLDSGQIERFMQKGDEDPILVSTIGPKTTFGFTSFLFNTQRVSTIRAKERTLLWELDKPTFELFQDSSSDIASIANITDRRKLRRLLQNHFLFNRLDKLGPHEIESFFPVKFRAGEEVFKQGDAGDNFYIIKSGEFERHIRPRRSTRNGENGNGYNEKRSRVKTLGEGQSFGELSLMYNAPRSATIRARTDAECWAISAESYHRLNLGSGTPRLRAIFEKNASVERDGEVFMTRKDLLRFTNIDAFPKEERERLASLLVSLVASNRARDPMMKSKSAEVGGVSEKEELREDAEDDILMDYWEFVRFDIILNNPNAMEDFAFNLTDKTNRGFISLDDIETMAHDYADIDEDARKMYMEGSSILRKVFGKSGTRTLSSKEFRSVSADVLPTTFRRDVERLTNHMLHTDIGKSVGPVHDTDVDEMSFVEPDGAPSVVGSQFMGSLSKKGATVGLQQFQGVNETPTWVTNIDWGHLVSIAVSGAVSRTAVAPLERLKILMQTGGPSQYNKGWMSGAREMVKRDTSTVRALFRGNGANVIRIIPAAVIQLYVIDKLRDMRIIRNMMHNGKGSTTPTGSSEVLSGGTRARAVEAVVVGGLAGMASSTATYPFDFIRGRLSVQRAGFEQYRGTFHGIREAARVDGLRSLYRGLAPTLAGVFPYVGLSFATYETLRPILPKRNDDSGSTTTGSSIVCGIFAGSLSQIAAFPLDTCRHRMQVAGFDSSGNSKATTFSGAWKEIGQQMGWRGYFRGLLPNLVKAVPAFSVSFLMYEQVRGGMTRVEDAVESVFAKPSPHVRTA